MENKAHELDDGATEAVDVHPLRRLPDTRSVADAVRTPVGGRLAQAVVLERDDFVIVRMQLGAAKITVGHLKVFSVLWRLWAAKRVQGGDPGVAVSELAAAANETKQTVQLVLTTCVRNLIVRSVRTNVGWANVRALYYPTELGTQMLALAEALGLGASIQIGRTATAWKSRSDDEPDNFFRHAAFLRGTNLSVEGNCGNE